MPQILPIKDLRHTSEISELCHKKNEPVFITKNGYGDMVVMSMETYESIWRCQKYMIKFLWQKGKSKKAIYLTERKLLIG